MIFFRSFRVILVTAIFVINLCILPFAISKVMAYVEQGYAVQFVDNARSTASLLSAQLSTRDVNQDSHNLAKYLDDLIGLGHLSYAQLLPDNGPVIVPQKTLLTHLQFIEDVSFGQHDDGMYFIAGPFFDSSEKLVGLYRFGFDESVTQFQMKNAEENIVFYAILFFVLSSIVIVFFSKKITQPIVALTAAANKIAAGDMNVTLAQNSKISEVSSLLDSLEQMRGEIRSNEIYVSEIMNNMADALIVISDDWTVHDMNWEAQKLFKRMRDEIVGHEFSALFSEDLMQNMKDQIDDNQLDSLCFEWAGCKRRDICLYLELKLSIVDIKSGSYIICSVRDMTIRKEIESALLNAKQNAEDANNAKSTFLSTVSHELRTPLNAILGYSDLLLEDAVELDNPHFIQDIKNIRVSGAHLLGLINNILDISKIEAGKMEINVSIFSMKILIDELVHTLAPDIEGNGNLFDVDTGILDIELQTDYFKLKQIFINLINNAAKFTSNGKIRLGLNAVNDEFIEFVLQDTGIGISQENMVHLFNSFSQADSRSNREFEGAGLGLTISQKLIHLLNGDIRVESELGKGTTCFIRLSVHLPGNNENLNLV